MMELEGGIAPIVLLKNMAKRQTLIIDSCRRFDSKDPYYPTIKLADMLEDSILIPSTRDLFSSYVMDADEGLIVLYSCSKGQASNDSNEGGVYLSSLINAAKFWRRNIKDNACLD